jgi:hypothetical protein
MICSNAGEASTEKLPTLYSPSKGTYLTNFMEKPQCGLASGN